MKKMKSLFDIINSSLIEGVLPKNFSLPSIDDGKIKWADGAIDGVAIYHMGRTEADEKDLALMEEAVRASAASDYDKAVELFTELGKQKRALELIDDVQKFIIEHSDELPARNVFKTSVDIITKSDDRECVKYGLSMLELFNLNGNNELISKVMTLGLSDEFTLFALFILLRLDNGNELVFELAKKVRGWGRIHAVERLEPVNDEIKDWILKEGIDNNVLSAYSALTCFNKADVCERMKGDLTEDEFRGVREIIAELLNEGPVLGCSVIEGWDKYVEMFLEKAKLQKLCDRDYEVINSIKAYFENEEKVNKEIVDMCNSLIL